MATARVLAMAAVGLIAAGAAAVNGTQASASAPPTDAPTSTSAAPTSTSTTSMPTTTAPTTSAPTTEPVAPAYTLSLSTTSPRRAETVTATFTRCRPGTPIVVEHYAAFDWTGEDLGFDPEMYTRVEVTCADDGTATLTVPAVDPSWLSPDWTVTGATVSALDPPSSLAYLASAAYTIVDEPTVAGGTNDRLPATGSTSAGVLALMGGVLVASGAAVLAATGRARAAR